MAKITKTIGLGDFNGTSFLLHMFAPFTDKIFIGAQPSRIDLYTKNMFAIVTTTRQFKQFLREREIIFN